MAKKGKRTVKVDFSNVKEGGGKRPHVPPGDYLARLTDPKIVEAQSGNTMVVVQWKLLDKKADKKAGGKTVRDNFVLVESAAWRLYNMLQASGKKVPKKMMSIDLDKIDGIELGITLDDEEYKNNTYSEVKDYLSKEELEGPDDDEEEEDEEDEDEEEDEDDDDEELEEVELDEL
jgi:hypothetical protein